MFLLSALVLRAEKKNHSGMSLFKSPELNKKEKSLKIKHEGIYLFGGKDDQGKFHNDLKILKIGKPNVEIVTIAVQGSPPSPRISSSLTFSEELYFCVVFGGKDEKENIMKDIFLLSLDTMTWSQIFVFGQPARRTSEHSAGLFNSTKLIIFGGINQKKYHGSDLFMINFEIFEKRSKNRALSQKNSVKKGGENTVSKKTVAETRDDSSEDEDRRKLKSVTVKYSKKNILLQKRSVLRSANAGGLAQKALNYVKPEPEKVVIPEKFQNLFLNSKKVLQNSAVNEVVFEARTGKER